MSFQWLRDFLRTMHYSAVLTKATIWFSIFQNLGQRQASYSSVPTVKHCWGELITTTHPMHLTPSRGPCRPPGQDIARTVLVLSPCAPSLSLHSSTGHFVHTSAVNGGQAGLVIRLLQGSCGQQGEVFSMPPALTSMSQVVNP